jgi:ankyrin repeat protein
MAREIVNVRSAICDACREGHPAVVELLLTAREFDLNQKSSFEDPEAFQSRSLPEQGLLDDVPLTIAVTRGDCDLAKMLLGRGANPNIMGAKGKTALFIAAENGFEKMISLLLDHELIDPDAMSLQSQRFDEFGVPFTQSRPLLAAAGNGHLGCVKMLSERAQRNLGDGLCRNVLWHAAVGGYCVVMAEVLNWSDIEISTRDPTVEDIAEESEDSEELVSDVIKPTALGCLPLCCAPFSAAIRHKQEEAALLLLPHAKLGECWHCGQTALWLAVKSKLYKLIDELLPNDCIGVDGQLTVALQRLGAAARSKSAPKRKEIIEQGWTKVFLDVERLLSEHKGNQFDRTIDGKPYFDYFLDDANNQINCQHLFSLLDFDVNEKDSDGFSLLHRACRAWPRIVSLHFTSDYLFAPDSYYLRSLNAKVMPLINMLLGHSKIDVNIGDSDGTTPLCWAIKTHQLDTVRAILGHKEILVNAEDSLGNTALLLASTYFPILEQVLSEGHREMSTMYNPALENDKQWITKLDSQYYEYDKEILALILNHKDTSIVYANKYGQSAVDVFSVNGTKDMHTAVLRKVKS